MMRLLDYDHNKSTRNILILLRLSEAQELRDSINNLLQNNDGSHHHINNDEYTHEITIALYDDNIDLFNDRIKKLIESDI